MGSGLLGLMVAVNAIAGDASWIEAHARAPGPGADERSRIEVHLGWVEGRLRASDVSGLAPEVRARREAALDELGRYRAAARFPRREDARVGRRPLWRDSDGRLCAVAHLVAWSGDRRLLERIARRHAGDYVLDMNEPALAAWAGAHGFTVIELAAIQPTYRDRPSLRMPSRHEEERRRRQPRPLTTEDVNGALGGLSSSEVLHGCLGDRDGAWSMTATARVEAAARHQPLTSVRLEPREPRVEACLKARLLGLIQNLLQSANYRWRGAVSGRVSFPIRVADVASQAAELARAVETLGLRECVVGLPPERLPHRFVVEVYAGSGSMRIVPRVVWTELPEDELAMLRCLAERIGRGRLERQRIGEQQYDVALGREGPPVVTGR